jgi:hypothetical protein
MHTLRASPSWSIPAALPRTPWTVYVATSVHADLGDAVGAV